MRRHSWRVLGLTASIIPALIAATIAAAYVTAVQTAAVVTTDNYTDVLRSCREGRLADDEKQRAVRALLEIYLQTGDSQIPLSIAELHSRNPDVLGESVSRLVEVVENPPHDRVMCDLCDMFIRLGRLPSDLEKALASQLSRDAATAPPPFGLLKAAAVLLKSTGSDEARGFLETACRHEKASIRVAAAHALGVGGIQPCKTSVEELSSLLQDPSPAVRTIAAEAIWRLTSDSDTVTPVLLAAARAPPEAVVLRPSSPSAWVFHHRLVAVICLGQMKVATPAVIDALVILLRDDDSDVRFYATRALGELDDQSDRVRQALEELEQDSQPAVRHEAARVLDSLRTTWMKTGTLPVP